MGLRNKSARRQQRRKEKRAKKEAQKARYKGYAEAGINQKSKRFSLKSKKEERKVRTIRHPKGACYNIGCVRCSNIASMLHNRKQDLINQNKKIR